MNEEEKHQAKEIEELKIALVLSEESQRVLTMNQVVMKESRVVLEVIL